MTTECWICFLASRTDGVSNRGKVLKSVLGRRDIPFEFVKYDSLLKKSASKNPSEEGSQPRSLLLVDFSLVFAV